MLGNINLIIWAVCQVELTTRDVSAVVWMCVSCPPTNSSVETLPPDVMVLGGEALGRCWGHDGGALGSGINALIKDTPES